MIKYLKSLFIKDYIDKDYINIISKLDNILKKIYGTSNDGCTKDEIFSDNKDPEYSVLLSTFFNNDNDPQFEAIKHLLELGLIQINTNQNKYYLTFKGISRLHYNSFEQEYRREAQKNFLLKQHQENGILRNNIAIIISVITFFIAISSYL